jgi:DNA invertase Pin-like site-specific DNA recombinase
MKKRQALRAGLYAMVSTADQQTLPMQIAEMRDYAHRRGWAIVKELQDVNGRTSVFAQFERDVLRDRVRVGLEHARRRGKTLGRPATVQAQADKILELLAAGVPKKTIAQQLGIGRASVYRAIEAMPSLKS